MPFAWEPHSEDENCVCKGLNKDSRGRPPKRKTERTESESDTESGQELEDEKEKASCSIFREMTQNLHLLDEELAKSLCHNIFSIFGFVLIDPNDILSSVKAIDRPLTLQLVETIFSVEREYVKDDDIDLSYKNIGDLLSITPEYWLSSRNLVLNSAVNGLSDSKTKPLKKVMALDHMYSLVKPSFISPFKFGSNLVMYSISRSKMAVNIYMENYTLRGNIPQ